MYGVCLIWHTYSPDINTRGAKEPSVSRLSRVRKAEIEQLSRTTLESNSLSLSHTHSTISHSQLEEAHSHAGGMHRELARAYGSQRARATHVLAGLMAGIELMSVLSRWRRRHVVPIHAVERTCGCVRRPARLAAAEDGTWPLRAGRCVGCHTPPRGHAPGYPVHLGPGPWI